MKDQKSEFVRKTEDELRTAYVDLNRKAKAAGLSPETVSNVRMAMLEAKEQSGLKGLDFTLINHLLALIIGLEETLDHIERYI